MIAYRQKYDPQAEIETLQTDIMRFMAILGFCLMTIFALVQSIPTGKADARPRLELKQSLEQQVSDLQAFITELEQKRDEVETQYQTLLAQQDNVSKSLLNSESVLLEKEQTIAELNAQEQQMRQQSDTTREQLEQQLLRIQSLDQTLQEKKQHVTELQTLAQSTQSQLTQVRLKVNREQLSLNSIERQLNNASKSLDTVKHDIEIKQLQKQMVSQSIQSLADQQQDMSAAMTKLNRERQAKIRELQAIKAKQQLAQQQARQKPVAPVKTIKTPSKKPVTAQVTKPERKGFSLRFSSDRVLTTLVKRGQVDFFALTNNQAYRVYNGEFIKASKPRQYHQMAVETVPSIYQSLLRNKYTFYRPNSITWGVALPNQMKREITAITSQHKGGDLVIQSGGKILLEP